MDDKSSIEKAAAAAAEGNGEAAEGAITMWLDQREKYCIWSTLVVTAFKKRASPAVIAHFVRKMALCKHKLSCLAFGAPAAEFKPHEPVRKDYAMRAHLGLPLEVAALLLQDDGEGSEDGDAVAGAGAGAAAQADPDDDDDGGGDGGGGGSQEADTAEEREARARGESLQELLLLIADLMTSKKKHDKDLLDDGIADGNNVDTDGGEEEEEEEEEGAVEHARWPEQGAEGDGQRVGAAPAAPAAPAARAAPADDDEREKIVHQRAADEGDKLTYDRLNDLFVRSLDRKSKQDKAPFVALWKAIGGTVTLLPKKRGQPHRQYRPGPLRCPPLPAVALAGDATRTARALRAFTRRRTKVGDLLLLFCLVLLLTHDSLTSLLTSLLILFYASSSSSTRRTARRARSTRCTIARACAPSSAACTNSSSCGTHTAPTRRRRPA